MSWRERIAKTIADGIRAYHGSPHNFDKFDLSKVGTGEGAQAFGHGLYFADRESIAKSYRNDLQKTVSPHLMLDDARITNSMVERMKKSADPAESYLARNYPDILLSRGKGSYDKLYELRDKAMADVEMWRKRLADYNANPPIASTYKPVDYEVFGHTAQNRADMIGEMISRLQLNKGGPTGKMYEVNLATAPERLLNLDVPVGQQTPYVEERLHSLGLRPDMVSVDKTRAQANDLIEMLRGVKGYAPWVADDLTGISQQVAAAQRPTQVYDAVRDIPNYYGIKPELKLFATQNTRLPLTPQTDIWKDVAPDVFSSLKQMRQGLVERSALAQVEGELGGRVPAAETLRDAGIPGNRYFDAGSRTVGGTSNYVVNDPGIIDIMRKYAIPAAPAGTIGMGALAGQDQYEAPQ